MSTEILAIYDALDEDRKTQLADEARRLLEDLQKQLTAQVAAWVEDQRTA
jgi:Skp family chaperone for outer membrane proteins